MLEIIKIGRKAYKICKKSFGEKKKQLIKKGKIIGQKQRTVKDRYSKIVK